MNERAAIGRPSAALAGVVSAGVALGVGELAAGLSDEQPSLVSAVGAEFIDRFAASLKEIAVELFGANDKAALVVGIVMSALLLGAVFGLLACRRFWYGAAGFLVFGLIGAWAYSRDPLGSTAIGVVLEFVAACAGIGSLAALLRLAARGDAPGAVLVLDGVASGDGMVAALLADATDPRRTPRRTFLVGAAMLSVGAASAAIVGRRFRGGGDIEAARRSVTIPRPTVSMPVPPDSFAVDGLSSYITTTGDFYRIDTALTVPHLDPGSWELGISGRVDNPFTVTYDELLSMDAVEETVTLQCVSNEVGGTLVGNATWQGVPLADLLRRARPHAEATQVVGRSIDRFTAGFPTELALDGRVAIVAYAMNGEPLPARHGFPARLIVAGLYGYVSATKWLREIELTSWDAFDGYWISRGWAKEGPIKTTSRIDVPRPGSELVAGAVPIAGVAWAPTRGISAVEVRIDDGEWRTGQLGDVASDNTWVQWLHVWNAPVGDHQITVRAIDGDGHVQIGDVSNPAPDGATGWHSRRVRVHARS